MVGGVEIAFEYFENGQVDERHRDCLFIIVVLNRLLVAQLALLNQIQFHHEARLQIMRVAVFPLNGYELVHQLAALLELAHEHAALCEVDQHIGDQIQVRVLERLFIVHDCLVVLLLFECAVGESEIGLGLARV